MDPNDHPELMSEVKQSLDEWFATHGVGVAIKPSQAFAAGWQSGRAYEGNNGWKIKDAEIRRLNTLVDTLSRALARYQDEEDEVGGDDPADHPYQRRGSWSADDWCAVDGCTSRASAHP